MPRLIRADTRRSRLLVAALLVGAVALLGGSLLLLHSLSVQTAGLGTQLRFTQDTTDANVRTISQAQREVLRLQVVLLRASTPAEIALERDLVTQRVHESSLPYQAKALGSQALLQQSRDLASTWDRTLRPAVDRLVSGGPAQPALRQQALARLHQMELGYNELSSDGENNRKRRAGVASEAAASLMNRTSFLGRSLDVIFGGFVLFLVLAAVVYARMDRRARRDAAALQAADLEMRMLSQVASTTESGVIITDPQGRTMWVNDAFVRATGYTLDDVRGQSPGTLLQGPGTNAQTVEFMRSRLAEGLGFTCEVRNYRSDGTPFWSGIEVRPVHDDSGEIAHFIAIQTDITQRREFERSLQEAKRNAERVAQEKASFLATMSHEIRTPLNAVLGLTELLLTTDLSEEQRQFASTAHGSGALLLAVVNDILDFSALETDSVELERRELDLAAVVAQSADLLRPDAARRGLTLATSIDPSIPAALLGDETRLRQILINLMSNGLKFTAQGGVTVAARMVPGDPTGDLVELSVVDTGIGIPPDRIDRLFQPFVQVDTSTTRKYGGTGLGLAICARLAERMGSEIEVSSTPGRGSRFSLVVRLPHVPTEIRLPGPRDKEQAPVPVMRILVAEDDDVNRLVVGHMLRGLGQDVDVVNDGAAAVKAAFAEDFDVILTDLHMPHLDGVEVAARIRQQMGPEAPYLVCLTANALPGDRERLLTEGFDDYLSKPLTSVELAAVLRRASKRPVATTVES